MKTLICNNCKTFWIDPVKECECGCKILTKTHESNYEFAKNYIKL